MINKIIEALFILVLSSRLAIVDSGRDLSRSFELLDDSRIRHSTVRVRGRDRIDENKCHIGSGNTFNFSMVLLLEIRFSTPLVNSL